MIRIIEAMDIATEQWQQLVDSSPTASFFQTKECYDFYSSLSFLDPFVFGVSENGKLAGLICGYIIADGGSLKQFFSRRAIVPGGLLLDRQISAEALKMLLTFSIKTLKKKAIYVELRNYNDYSPYKKQIEQTGFVYGQHFDLHAFIDDKTEQRFSKSKRRQIKTAQKNDVQYFETEDIVDIETFYRILTNLYSKQIKLPLFPLEFFLKLSQLPQGKILVIKHNNTVIGGMACVELPGKALYEWFVCGNERVKKQLYSSVMATWAGIDYAIQHKISMFDFMGAGKPSNNYGVREFKSKFGGKLVEYGRFVCVTKSLRYSIGKFVVKKLKKHK
ncbi:MAG: aminoacyltransferase [Prevotellaceae bacterium]|jgi:lipid II:glycine glycyltransferase (peptidoglycan interpeptide bridge formation enzyme)|nr:aminoacyltransferase [Prevotellaceae bacterium]